jgi:hypothetical protein
MAKAWHLSRGNESHGPISDRELFLLAELGQLRSDDLLWRPGFDGWRTANSPPGVLSPPPLPSGASLIARAAFRLRLDKIYNWLVARWGEFPLLAKAWSKSIQLYVRDGYTHIKQVRFDRGTFASRVRYPQLLVGLLLAVVGVCALDMARHSFFAISSQAAPHDSGLPEIANVALNSTTADTVISLPSTDPPVLEEAASDQTINDDANGSSVIDPQPSDALISIANPILDAPSTAVPLPTKKPAKPVKTVSTAQAGRPKPMRFGTIGFNYLDQ